MSATSDVDLDQRFSDLGQSLDYPMYVVTAAGGDERSGCLVGFATQSSIHPPRFLAAISKKNHTLGVALKATHLGVHLLAPDNLDLARLFGAETGDEVDKFERCQWSVGPYDVPVLDEAPAWFVGRVLDRIDFGDHVGHQLEPVHVEVPRPTLRRLGFADVRDLDPGHDA